MTKLMLEITRNVINALIINCIENAISYNGNRHKGEYYNSDNSRRKIKFIITATTVSS